MGRDNARVARVPMRISVQFIPMMVGPRKLQAKLHYYGTKAVIHVVGPDFNNRTEPCSRDRARLRFGTGEA